MLCAERKNSKYQFNSLWFDTKEDRTHDLLHRGEYVYNYTEAVCVIFELEIYIVLYSDIFDNLFLDCILVKMILKLIWADKQKLEQQNIIN
jgi:hypothetical protein